MGALSVTVVVRAGENGLLVKPGDAESLADGIERLCNDGALCEGLAKAVRTDYEENYSFDAWAERYFNFYGRHCDELY